MADIEHITVNGENYDISDPTARAGVESEMADRKDADDDLEKKIKENTDLIDSLDILSDNGGSIPTYSDLNDYQTPGKYYCANASNASTLENCPVSVGFSLYVTQQGNSNGRYQILFSNSTAGAIYFRMIQGTTNIGSWNRISTS